MKRSANLAIAATAALLGGCVGEKAIVPGEIPGDLALLSSPSGARAHVEQIRSGREFPIAIVEATPDTVRGLTEGSYHLSFSLPGYASLDTVVVVESGMLKTVAAPMRPEDVAVRPSGESRP